MATVRLQQLEKVFPGSRRESAFRAVKGIDLEIRDKEFMVLVGPSGCGKSTTLRMIAGLEEVSGGAVEIDGVVVNEALPKDRDIAMVFQNYALYPHMTARQNMAFGLKLRKFSKQEIAQRVEEAARILGLEDLLDRKPQALSGGQRQRVAVGRAIVRNPKVFLFDEPLSNLDAKMRVSMRAEISKLHSRLRATMIYVTHDQMEAMTMGDRICVMNEGEIMQVDEPMTLYNRPANLFVAGFIGSPAMNLIKGTIVSENGGLCFEEDAKGDGGGGLRIALDASLSEALSGSAGRKVVFGVRPEDIRIAENEAAVSAVGPRFSAITELSEPTGAEALVYLNTGAHTVIVRTSGRERLPDGVTVSATVDPDRIHLFDQETGNRLG